MLTPGLVSITFRRLVPREIIDLVVRAGQCAIEWGGDVHVPHGDLARAREVKQMTLDAGLQVASYGSYYHLGLQEPVPFETVLETAVFLGAPVIRVWAGKKGSAEADAEYRARVVRDGQRSADLAAQAGLEVALEFHRGTLTDTYTSARMLLEEIGRPKMTSYWQPPVGASVADCLEGIRALLPWLRHVHVFHWDSTAKVRFPLAADESVWRQYLQAISLSGRNHFVLLEFVKDDAPEQYLEDAATLNEWLAAFNKQARPPIL